MKEKSRRNVVGDAGVDNLATRCFNRSFFSKGHKMQKRIKLSSNYQPFTPLIVFLKEAVI